MYPKRYSGPNRDVLEAQARVCTGPHQTRPLGAKSADTIQPGAILKTVLKSVRGELPPEHAVLRSTDRSVLRGDDNSEVFPGGDTVETLGRLKRLRDSDPNLRQSSPKRCCSS